MQQSQFLHLQEIVSAVARSEARRECRRALDRVRSEMAEIRAATQKTIIESRELMAQVDEVIAWRERLRNAPPSTLVHLNRSGWRSALGAIPMNKFG
jgi:anti-sigma-K factor RskA